MYKCSLFKDENNAQDNTNKERDASRWGNKEAHEGINTNLIGLIGFSIYPSAPTHPRSKNRRLGFSNIRIFQVHTTLFNTRARVPYRMMTGKYLEERAAWLNTSTGCKEPNCPLPGIHVHAALPCTSPLCPIKHPHLRGRYLHQGEFADQQPWPNSNEGGSWNKIWGSNNPPPEIWLAYFRYRAGIGSMENDMLVEDFTVSHMFIDLSGRGRGDLL